MNSNESEQELTETLFVSLICFVIRSVVSGCSDMRNRTLFCEMKIFLIHHGFQKEDF